jgi:hypothetical protein
MASTNLNWVQRPLLYVKFIIPIFALFLAIPMERNIEPFMLLDVDLRTSKPLSPIRELGMNTQNQPRQSHKTQKPDQNSGRVDFAVGATGFEPVTPCL